MRPFLKSDSFPFIFDCYMISLSIFSDFSSRFGISSRPSMSYPDFSENYPDGSKNSSSGSYFSFSTAIWTYKLEIYSFLCCFSMRFVN